jgi:hypothetical protein
MAEMTQEEFDFRMQQKRKRLQRSKLSQDKNANQPTLDQMQADDGKMLRDQIEQSVQADGGSGTFLRDIATLFQTGATMGQSPNIQGALSILTGGDFQQGREQMLAQEAGARENLGGLGVLPEVAGGVVTGRAVTEPILQTYRATAPMIKNASEQGLNWLGKAINRVSQPDVRNLASGMAVGGAEGTVYAQGQGLDPTTGALFGAGGVPVAQGLVKGISKLDDALSILRNPERRAAEQFNRASTLAGNKPETMQQDLESQLAVYGPERSLLETSPEMRQTAVSAVGPNVGDKTLLGLRNVTERNVADLAQDEMDMIFNPAVSKTTAGENAAKVKETLQTEYTTVLADADKKGIRFSPAALLKTVDNVFQGMKMGQRGTMYNRVKTELESKLPRDADGNLRMMTPAEVLTVKQYLDELIPNAKVDGEPISNKTRADLIELKNQVNNTLKDYIPGYGDVSSKYASQASTDAARTLGEQAAKRSKTSIEDLQAFLSGASTAEKSAFAEGHRYALEVSGEQGGIENVFKRVGPTKSNAALETIEAIYGPKVADQFVTASRRITEISKTGKDLSRARLNAVGALSQGGKEKGLIRSLIDRTIIGSQVAQGKGLGGASVGSAAREGTRTVGKRQAESNSQLLDWMSKTGADADEALLSIVQNIERNKNKNLTDYALRTATTFGSASQRQQ